MSLAKWLITLVFILFPFGQSFTLLSPSWVFAQEDADEDRDEDLPEGEDPEEDEPSEENDHEEEDDEHSDEEEDDEDHEGEDPEEDPLEEDDEEDDSEEDEGENTFLYGDVIALDLDTLYLEDIPIDIHEDAPPITRFLTSDMFIEAYGKWQGDNFIVETFEVIGPEDWSYFEGPLAALTGEDDLSALRTWRYSLDGFENERTEWLDEDTDEIIALAYFDGTSFIQGFDFLPMLNLAADEWYVFEGSWENNEISWQSIIPLVDWR